MFTVVTDLGSGHSTWFEKGVEKIFIASDSIRNIALKRGKVPANKLIMSGLPIRKDFATKASYIGKSRDSIQAKIHQEKIRDQLQLSKAKGNENHKVILLMGGGEGVGSLSQIVECIYSELTLAHMNATIAVVCGRNDELKTSLKERNWEEVLASYINRTKDMKDRVSHGLKEIASITKRTLSLRSEHEKGEKNDRNHMQNGENAEKDEQGSNVIVHPLGFVNNMAEFMVAADILVTKAGPVGIVHHSVF
jgi:1,2-diacylglycerol 3-beta-galactosyltransferase